MPSSSLRIRSFSGADSSSRASRATCSTSTIVIFGAPATLDLLQMRVLQRETLAAHAGEVDGGDHVRALALHPDPQALGPPRVAQLGAQAEREVVPAVRLGRRGHGGDDRVRPPRVQELELLLRNLEEEA